MSARVRPKTNLRLRSWLARPFHRRRCRSTSVSPEKRDVDDATDGAIGDNTAGGESQFSSVIGSGDKVGGAITIGKGTGSDDPPEILGNLKAREVKISDFSVTLSCTLTLDPGAPTSVDSVRAFAVAYNPDFPSGNQLSVAAYSPKDPSIKVRGDYLDNSDLTIRAARILHREGYGTKAIVGFTGETGGRAPAGIGDMLEVEVVVSPGTQTNKIFVSKSVGVELVLLGQIFELDVTKLTAPSDTQPERAILFKRAIAEGDFSGNKLDPSAEGFEPAVVVAQLRDQVTGNPGRGDR